MLPEAEDLRRQLSLSLVQLRRLQVKLGEAEGALERARLSHASELEAGRRAQDLELNTLHNKLSQLTAERDALRDRGAGDEVCRTREIEVLGRELHTAQTRAEAGEGRLKQVEAKFQELQSESASLKSQISEARELAQSQKEQLDDFKKKLVEGDRERAGMSESNKTLESCNAALKSEVELLKLELLRVEARHREVLDALKLEGEARSLALDQRGGELLKFEHELRAREQAAQENEHRLALLEARLVAERADLAKPNTPLPELSVVEEPFEHEEDDVGSPEIPWSQPPAPRAPAGQVPALDLTMAKEMMGQLGEAINAMTSAAREIGAGLHTARQPEVFDQDDVSSVASLQSIGRMQVNFEQSPRLDPALAKARRSQLGLDHYQDRPEVLRFYGTWDIFEQKRHLVEGRRDLLKQEMEAVRNFFNQTLFDVSVVQHS